MLLRDFFDLSDPILRWRSFFRIDGRISRRGFWRASSSVARWTFGIALLITALTAGLGAWIDGWRGLPIGLAAGVLVGALLQAAPLIALMIQRLHDLGWSAKILVALLSAVLGSLLLFVATVTTQFAQLQPVMPWLVGCAFVGIAAHVGLGWFLLLVEGGQEENQYGPLPRE